MKKNTTKFRLIFDVTVDSAAMSNYINAHPNFGGETYVQTLVRLAVIGWMGERKVLLTQWGWSAVEIAAGPLGTQRGDRRI